MLDPTDRNQCAKGLLMHVFISFLNIKYKFFDTYEDEKVSFDNVLLLDSWYFFSWIGNNFALGFKVLLYLDAKD